MIDKNSSIPLYNQLIDELIVEIEKKLQPNDKLISEREICQRFDVSRTTVRLALMELENMGYIYKRHGKGTFVSNTITKRENLMANYSFTDQMRQLNKEPETLIISLDKILANQHIAEKMGITENESVFRLERVRLADKETMMYEISYIPEYLFKGFTYEQISNRPLYEVFREDYQQIVKIADEEFSASIVTDKEAKMLRVASDSPCLRIQRFSFNKENLLIEYTLSVARSDKFIYKVRHKN